MHSAPLLSAAGRPAGCPPTAAAPSAAGQRGRALAALRPHLRFWARSSTALAARASTAVTGRARAYCGAAHQVEWDSTEWPPPESVDVPAGDGRQPYRLVHCPLTGEPARDLRGALVYVPARARGRHGD